MKPIFVIIFWLVSVQHFASAEVIDGPANIRDERSLDILVTLNDSCLVDANVRSEKWYYVERPVWVKPEYIQNEIDGEAVLIKGSPLLDANGAIIGSTSKVVSLPILQDNGTLDEILVLGLTNRTNIRTQSIPELEVEALAVDGVDRLKEMRWEDFMVRHKIEHWNKLENSIDVFIKFKAELMGSPDPRIIILFQKRKLIAVLFSEKVNLPKCSPERFLEMWLYFFDESPSMQNETKMRLEAALMGAG